MTHDLKTWTEYFSEVWDGKKTFEVRKNDRDYKVGDYLALMEYMNEDSLRIGHDVFTYRTIMCRIDYILNGGNFGIEPEYIVMSITVTDKRNRS